MHTLSTAVILIVLSTSAVAQQPPSRPSPASQRVACEGHSSQIIQMAQRGFQTLGTHKSCSAVPVLESTYRALDTGRAQCGRQWVQKMAMLESDLLDALDYAGEICYSR